MLMPRARWCGQQCPWQQHPCQAGRGAAERHGGVLALLAAAGRAQGLLGWPGLGPGVGVWEAEPTHGVTPPLPAWVY